MTFTSNLMRKTHACTCQPRLTVPLEWCCPRNHPGLKSEFPTSNSGKPGPFLKGTRPLLKLVMQWRNKFFIDKNVCIHEIKCFTNFGISPSPLTCLSPAWINHWRYYSLSQACAQQQIRRVAFNCCCHGFQSLHDLLIAVVSRCKTLWLVCRVNWLP